MVNTGILNIPRNVWEYSGISRAGVLKHQTWGVVVSAVVPGNREGRQAPFTGKWDLVRGTLPGSFCWDSLVDIDSVGLALSHRPWIFINFCSLTLVLLDWISFPFSIGLF